LLIVSFSWTGEVDVEACFSAVGEEEFELSEDFPPSAGKSWTESRETGGGLAGLAAECE